MQNNERLAYKFKIMGHPIRLQILQMLRQGETCVCHIEHAIGRRQAYVSQQLMVLRDTGLVTYRKLGQQVYYNLADAELIRLLDFLYATESNKKFEIFPDCPCPTCLPMTEEQK